MGRDKKDNITKKQKYKHKHKKDKKKHKKSKKKTNEGPMRSKTNINSKDVKDSGDECSHGFEIPIELMNTKSHAPESKEEYERRQSKIRHEKDPITGRIRLIKGDGEVLEEIVSRNHSQNINKLATASDGEYYQAQTIAKKQRN